MYSFFFFQKDNVSIIAMSSVNKHPTLASYDTKLSEMLFHIIFNTFFHRQSGSLFGPFFHRQLVDALRYLRQHNSPVFSSIAIFSKTYETI